MRRTKSIASHAQGFSLVEVLIALIILGVGLLGLARLQFGMIGGTADGVLHDSAIRLAEDKLESMRFELAAGHLPQPGSDEPKAYDVTLQRSWTSSANASGLLEATIIMRWREPRTGEESTLNLPARLGTSQLAAQAWLIQSGAPHREPLP